MGHRQRTMTGVILLAALVGLLGCASPSSESADADLPLDPRTGIIRGREEDEMVIQLRKEFLSFKHPIPFSYQWPSVTGKQCAFRVPEAVQRFCLPEHFETEAPPGWELRLYDALVPLFDAPRYDLSAFVALAYRIQINAGVLKETGCVSECGRPEWNAAKGRLVPLILEIVAWRRWQGKWGKAQSDVNLPEDKKAIRDEFMKLPRPIKVFYYELSTKKPDLPEMGAAEPPCVQVLAPDVRKLLEQHQPSDIERSLFPLLFSDRYAPDAFYILSGLPGLYPYVGARTLNSWFDPKETGEWNRQRELHLAALEKDLLGRACPGWRGTVHRSWVYGPKKDAEQGSYQWVVFCYDMRKHEFLMIYSRDYPDRIDSRFGPCRELSDTRLEVKALKDTDSSTVLNKPMIVDLPDVRRLPRPNFRAIPDFVIKEAEAAPGK